MSDPVEKMEELAFEISSGIEKLCVAAIFQRVTTLIEALPVMILTVTWSFTRGG